jgi:voltage-gated sodium channel
VFFVSFVLLGTFVVVNLFVAVVINSLEESHREVAEADALAERGSTNDAQETVRALRDLLTQFENRVSSLERTLRDSAKD